MEIIGGFLVGLIGTLIAGGAIVLLIAAVGWLIIKFFEWLFFDVWNI